MSDQLPNALVPILEKVAVDNGFDLELPREGSWLSFDSSHAPLRIWLTARPGPYFLSCFSRRDVALSLGGEDDESGRPLPIGALAARGTPDHAVLHRLVRRAFQLAKTLPDELLHDFNHATARLPRTTEAERLVVQRVGQDVFRKGLLAYWESRCAITGLSVVELLRASHIKPWADCTSDAERLDVYNGLLLAPHLDAAFDRGLMTVDDEGEVIISDLINMDERRLLGLDKSLRVRSVVNEHIIYLKWHRDRVFKWV